MPMYKGLKDVAVGVSFDLGDHTVIGRGANGYRGVYIHLPFEAMFINPAAPKSDHPRVGPAGIVTTMAHEIAHNVHKSEEDLAPYVQEIFATLWESETFDFVAFKNYFIQLTQANSDIYTWLVNFSHGQPFPVRRRGNRLEVGNDELEGEKERDNSSVGARLRVSAALELLEKSPDVPSLVSALRQNQM
jgi:hypothetical protein